MIALIDEELKQSMQVIFDRLQTSADKNAEQSPLWDFLVTKKQWLGDPEDMDTMIMFPFRNIIDLLIKTTIPKADWLVKDIYKDWAFFDNNITNLCSQFYGGGGSADRGRVIVKSAIKYRLTGELPVFDGKYWNPKTGTPEMWMELVEGLGRLKYGKFDVYFKALNTLVSDFQAQKSKE